MVDCTFSLFRKPNRLYPCPSPLWSLGRYHRLGVCLLLQWDPHHNHFMHLGSHCLQLTRNSSNNYGGAQHFFTRVHTLDQFYLFQSLSLSFVDINFSFSYICNKPRKTWQKGEKNPLNVIFVFRKNAHILCIILGEVLMSTLSTRSCHSPLLDTFWHPLLCCPCSSTTWEWAGECTSLWQEFQPILTTSNIIKSEQ